jgi:hypothetical protein
LKWYRKYKFLYTNFPFAANIVKLTMKSSMIRLNCYVFFKLSYFIKVIMIYYYDIYKNRQFFWRFWDQPEHTMVASMQCFLIDECFSFSGVDQLLHYFGVLWIMVLRCFNHAWSLTLQLKVIACGCPLGSWLIGLQNYSCLVALLINGAYCHKLLILLCLL